MYYFGSMESKTNETTAEITQTTFIHPDAHKRPVGAPPIYRSPKDLQKRIEDYFLNCITNDKAPTLAGLTLSIGFASQSWIQSYPKRSKGFRWVVSRAKDYIEDEINQRLLDKTTKNSNGAFRYLSAVFKYTEKAETKHTGNGPRTIMYPVKATVGAPIVTTKPVKKKVTKKKK